MGGRGRGGGRGGRGSRGRHYRERPLEQRQTWDVSVSGALLLLQVFIVVVVVAGMFYLRL